MGGAYLIGSQAVARLLATAQVTAVLPIEDVYVTGLCAAGAKVELHHSKRLVYFFFLNFAIYSDLFSLLQFIQHKCMYYYKLVRILFKFVNVLFKCIGILVASCFTVLKFVSFCRTLNQNKRLQHNVTVL